MKRSWIKWIALICVGIFGMVLFVACGGDGRDDDPISSIYGTYALESFRVRFADGVVLEPGDFDGYSGEMYIYPSNYIYQIICLRTGQDTNCTEADATLAGDHLVDYTPDGCEFRIPYSFDGSKLTISFPMRACGRPWSETDVWLKVSDTTPAAAEENHDDYKGSIGAIIGDLHTP